MNYRITLALIAASLAFAALDCRADTSIGLHVASVHVPQRAHHNNDNTGLYFKGEHWQAGMYRNSIDRTTAYAAYVHPVGGFDLMLGLASGYSKRCTTTTTVTPKKVVHAKYDNGDTGTTTYPSHTVTTEDCKGYARGAMAPMAGVSYLAPFRMLGAAPRLFLAPGFGTSSTVLHLSVEWRI